MTPKSILDKLNEQFTTIIGPGIESLNADVRQQVRAAAQAAFEKMDIVSREEFEAQKAVLLRSREKLEELENQLAVLEAQIKASQNDKAE